MEKKREGLTGGMILIVIGVFVLASNLIEFEGFKLGLLMLPTVSLLLLLWGIVTREAGPIIPGGIMAGISTGVLLAGDPWHWFDVQNEGGVFMLAFAAGWVLIVVLTAVFTDETHWWALIPGSIIALIGFTALYGGLFGSILAFLGQMWPLTLIALGVYVLLKVRGQSKIAE
jgi:hypothetical protein